MAPDLSLQRSGRPGAPWARAHCNIPFVSSQACAQEPPHRLGGRGIVAASLAVSNSSVKWCMCARGAAAARKSPSTGPHPSLVSRKPGPVWPQQEDTPAPWGPHHTWQLGTDMASLAQRSGVQAAELSGIKASRHTEGKHPDRPARRQRPPAALPLVSGHKGTVGPRRPAGGAPSQTWPQH